MPLIFGDYNKEYTIIQITGKDILKNHLNSMGFIEGEKVKIVSRMANNLIIYIKGVKVAINEQIGRRIIVS